MAKVLHQLDDAGFDLESWIASEVGMEFARAEGAAGGAQAAGAALTTRDAPGQVLQVSGVGPASAQANPAATAHANPNARGL